MNKASEARAYPSEPISRNGEIHAILVTYRRPDALDSMLRALVEQSITPTLTVVIDNSPEPIARRAAGRWEGYLNLRILEPGDNLGPAGGVALGMSELLKSDASGWVVLLDDDDPPSHRDLIGRLLEFAHETLQADPTTGGVGRAGARFDRDRGLVVRLRDEELKGAVHVDHIAGNQFPIYRLDAIRRVGVFRSDLFFGFEELEFGLRMKDAGYSLYVPGDWLAERRKRLNRRASPRTMISEQPLWRRYYSLRNLVLIQRSYGRTAAAIRISAIRAIGKPAVNLMRTPRTALPALMIGLRAVKDAWTGRTGRTLDPDW